MVKNRFSYSVPHSKRWFKNNLAGLLKSGWVAIRLTLVLLILCVVIYPIAILGIAKITPDKGLGEKIKDKNGYEYYTNIGQRFDEDRYFHTRPSAVDYNGAGSGGSNKGPTNPEYLAQVQERVKAFKVKNPGQPIPVDMVTASGSGLDPHISVLGASAQINRIAKTRGLKIAEVQKIVNKHIEKGVLGPEKINVLKLNIELDKLKN